MFFSGFAIQNAAASPFTKVTKKAHNALVGRQGFVMANCKPKSGNGPFSASLGVTWEDNNKTKRPSVLLHGGGDLIAVAEKVSISKDAKFFMVSTVKGTFSCFPQERVSHHGNTASLTKASDCSRSE